MRRVIATVLLFGNLSPTLLAQSGSGGSIVRAPEFDAAALTAPPARDWITNGGSVYNQRHSPLDQINRSNVSELRAMWRTSMGSADNFRNSGQTQILAFEGTLFVTNGENDVFALDADTGEILWTHRGMPDGGSGNPLGWANRGAALGDGKLFVTQIDARLKALDQLTGDVVWDLQAERWQDGFSITSAPLYYDGLVITGFSGGELGTRGRVKAYDADTGELVWTFYTVPAPNEFGGDTWPADSDAWTYGGAPVWQTPAVDPELGMIYFSTGNPGPDLHGGVRAGDNLFSVSIVALDAESGEYRWHFQQVHHDIWDYDSPNPIVLFNLEYDGEQRRALVEVSKTGWAYILDRESGEPILGIEERPVQQEPRQATSPTQPYPIGDAIVPQSIDIPPEQVESLTEGGQIINGGRIFTPFWSTPIAVKPGTMGGANWPPSSYDPNTGWLYVCASDRISSFRVNEELEQPGPNQVYMGGRFTQAQADDRGIFAAVDMRTNRIAWRQQWREICYSGSVVTAGGLLFVGRSDGRLTALDSRNGRLLWEFMTDAGVNTTVTTFEHDGEQRVVVHAGGGTFANATRGDGIWMFSLSGTMNSLPPPADNARAGRIRVDEELALEPADVEHGAEIYAQACVACHGPAGDGGHGGGPTLIDGLDATTIEAVTSAGRNTMPGFGSVYSAQDLHNLSTFILERLAQQP